MIDRGPQLRLRCPARERNKAPLIERHVFTQGRNRPQRGDLNGLLVEPLIGTRLFQRELARIGVIRSRGVERTGARLVERIESSIQVGEEGVAVESLRQVDLVERDLLATIGTRFDGIIEISIGKRLNQADRPLKRIVRTDSAIDRASASITSLADSGSKVQVKPSPSTVSL